MEVTPVTFGTYRTVFLAKEANLIAVWRMTRDFIFRHGLYSKLAMFFMIATMAFTLAFPTLASAMTAYSGNVEAFVNTTDDTYVKFQDFNLAVYIIHDGWRIGKQGNHIVTDGRPRGK
jgi:hypothetical protein